MIGHYLIRGAIRGYNAISGMVSSSRLDKDRLISAARRNARLHNLGDDFNDQALEVLASSINEEAGLHPFGIFMMKQKLIAQLESRLWVEYWYKKCPEIHEMEVLPIVLITGLQRTGTTKMQRLLSSLPAARGLMSWEALYPAPVGEEREVKKRQSMTKRNARAVRLIAPKFQAIHPIEPFGPEEDVLLLDLALMSSAPEAIMQVPSYADYLAGQNAKQAYAYEKKLLKLLQWQRGGSYWVLKSPHHLEYLDDFYSVFPKSFIIWMHRDPAVCIPSFLNMLYTGRQMFTDRVDKKALKIHWLNKLDNMLENGLAFRQRFPDKVIDIRFEDFMHNEKEVLHQLAKSCPFLEQVTEDAFSDKSPYRSRHNYDLADWGLTPNEIEKRFENYVRINLSLYGNDDATD